MHDRWSLSPMHPAPKIKHFCFLTLHFESYSVSWSMDLQYHYYLAWTSPGAVLCHSCTCLGIRYQGEETGTSLSSFPPQEAVECNEVASKLCVLQTGQPGCFFLFLHLHDKSWKLDILVSSRWHVMNPMAFLLVMTLWCSSVISQVMSVEGWHSWQGKTEKGNLRTTDQVYSIQSFLNDLF